MSDFWTPADEAAAAIGGYGPEEPLRSALDFMLGLESLSAGESIEQTMVGLLSIVTPESREAWDIFQDSVAAVRAIGDWGMASYPESPNGAPDVAYVKVLDGMPEVTQIRATRILTVAAWLTLVWRPEFGIWMIHGFGGNRVPPPFVPRTSPGVAPRYTTAPSS